MVRYCRLINVFEAFSCKTGDPHEFNCCGIKVEEDFFVISNLAVTSLITINYSKVNLFLSESLNWRSMLSVHLDLNITFSLQHSKSLSIVSP